MSRRSITSKHLATVGQKNSLSAGRKLQQNQVQGGAAICPNQLVVMGKRR